MIIDCIADLHGYYPKLDGGDLLIVAGDLTASDVLSQYSIFCAWLDEQKYTKKIVVAGNHDNLMREGTPARPVFSQYNSSTGIIKKYAEYLCDSGTEFDGLKIWGSPWTLTFDGMNPRCKAFTFDTEKELAEKWAMIPDDIDILVTHSPPYGWQDTALDGRRVGSYTLTTHLSRIVPKLHIFGHIHEAYGSDECSGIRFINASHVNEHYKPVNPPTRVIL